MLGEGEIEQAMNKFIRMACLMVFSQLILLNTKLFCLFPAKGSTLFSQFDSRLGTAQILNTSNTNCFT